MDIGKLNREEKTRKINQLQKDKKELIEAVEAGRRVAKTLSRLMDKLNSARNWGIWDILGGKLISNIGKHSAINAANKIANEVKNELREFEKELNDINEFAGLVINLSGFATFADFFFDGLFVDFFIQSKINNVRKNTENVLSSVDGIIQELEKDLYKINDLLKELESV